MQALMVASLAISAVGTLVGAAGAQAQGEAAQQEANYKAQQMEMKANEERAVAQRQMLETRRKNEFQQSRLRAAAAQSTGDTTDTGVINLAGEMENLSEYDALNTFARGENAARGYEDQATLARIQGENAKKAAGYKVAGTLLGGFGELGGKIYKQYG